MHGEVVVAEARDGIQFPDVIIPPGDILLRCAGRKGVHLVMGDLVAEPVRDGVGIGPLHREALLDVEMARRPVLLVPVAQEDPFGHGGVEGHGVTLGIGHRGRVGLILAHQHFEEGHDILAVGEGQALLGIGLVPPDQFLDPREGCRPLCGVMRADVAVVEGVGQCILGDDVEITPIEIRVTLVLLKTLPEDHVGWDEAAGIRSSEDKAVLGQIDQHVVPVHPAEPVTALGAVRKRNNEGVDRRHDRDGGNDPSGPASVREARFESGEESGGAEARQHDEERVAETLILVLHVPPGIVVAVVPRERLQECRETETDDEKVEPDALFFGESPEKQESRQREDQRDGGDVLRHDPPEDLAESVERLKG